MSVFERSRFPGSGGRFAVAVAAVAALAGLAPAAVAVQPKAGAKFAGKLQDYLNNAPHWAASAKEPVSFKVSSNRRRILAFRGRYGYYCGAGEATITAKYITVTKSGKFDYRFSEVAQSGGTIYVEIKGRFTGDGRSAELSYLSDYTGGKAVSQPYETANPSALGCASWVHGTVRAK